MPDIDREELIRLETGVITLTITTRKALSDKNHVSTQVALGGSEVVPDL